MKHRLPLSLRMPKIRIAVPNNRRKGSLRQFPLHPTVNNNPAGKGGAAVSTSRMFGNELSNYSLSENESKNDDLLSKRYLTRAEARKREEGSKKPADRNETRDKENINNENSVAGENDEETLKPTEIPQGRRRKKPQRPSTTTSLSIMNQLRHGLAHPKQPAELVHELDKKNLANPQKVPYYANDIFRYLKSIEKRNAVSADYMGRVQKDINDRMRKILVDWMVDVHLKLRLQPEVLFLSVSLVDRYLSKVPILRTQLQLVGVTALFIACKYEEIYPPTCDSLLFMTEYSYSEEQVFRMESKILKELEFQLTQASPYYFVRRYLENLDIKDPQLILMVNFLLELAQVDYTFLKYPPSLLAAAALYLTHKTFQIDMSSDFFVTNTEYSFAQLEDCTKDLCVGLYNSTERSASAVYRKYSRNSFGRIARKIIYLMRN